MHRTRIYSPAKTLSYAALGIVLLNTANAYAEVAQGPIGIAIGVQPNLFITLDDSFSMNYAYVPRSHRLQALGSGSRRQTSNHYNKLYYSPDTQYVIPPSFDENGNEVKLWTQFTNAPLNGFRPEARTTEFVDLSTNYRPTGEYYDFNNGNNIALRPQARDFQVTVRLLRNGTERAVSEAGIEFEVTRSGTKYTCEIKQSGPVLNTNGFSCSRVGTRYTAVTPPFYYSFDETLPKCNNPKTKNNDNEECYRLHFIKDDEKENFAIWYSFYRTRGMTTLASISRAFADMAPSTRLTWQNLGDCKTFDGSDQRRCKDNRLRLFDSLHKGQFYSWIRDTSFVGNTPTQESLKRVGSYLMEEDTPWKTYPNSRPGSYEGTDRNTTYTCRANYNVIMTDGRWDSYAARPSDFRDDSSSFILPDGKAYTGQRPYVDTTNSTFADWAMHYWATDLRPDLANKIPPYIPFKSGKDDDTDYWDSRNDPATWQHVNNFIVALGLTDLLDHEDIPWEGSTHAGKGYEALKKGTAQWPRAGSTSNNNGYDLWHAAINSRGEYFSSESPDSILEAFESVINRVADRKTSAARPAITSSYADTDSTVSYQTAYASADNWSGDVKRFEKIWNTDSGAFETKEIWSAKNKVPGWQNRNIKIAAPSSSSNSNLVNFTWSNAGSSEINGTLAQLLNRDPENDNVVDNKGQERLDYLRGNRTGEGPIFRKRSGLLGDIYGSTPVVVSGPRYLIGFTNRLEKTTSYSTFAEKVTTRTPRIYVGSNDGMLHGFNALTGVEEFAFIPSAVFPKLNKLTSRKYSHEFYVEGSPVVADIYIGNSEWRTILIGTLKAGGKSIFALDITTPGSEKLLWEFDDSSLPDDAAVKMGYSFSQPTIARLHNGKWAVVFGNGYESANSTNGKAALFIVDAWEGKLLKSLEVSGTPGIANGLSTPKLGDYNTDGVADYAYAGDLQGNVWRFDLLRNSRSDAAPFTTKDDGQSAINEFKVAYGGKPLFSAVADNGKHQPITAAPSLIPHETGLGHLVIFGTGKFFEIEDKSGDRTMPQTVYGIWDKRTLGQTTSDPNISRSSLQKQEIVETVTVTDGTTRKGLVISANNVQWQPTSGQNNAQNGWYLNLRQNLGEMVVENMSQLGRTVFFQSLVPSDDPCGDGVSNWTFAINPFTGGRTSHLAFDYKPTSDVGTNNISAIQQEGEGGGTISQNSDGSYQYCTGQECATIHPDPTSLGRQSWRRVDTQ